MSETARTKFGSSKTRGAGTFVNLFDPGSSDGEDILERYREEAIKAAKELFYPDTIIDRLLKAKTEAEISNIMADARNSS